MSTIYLIRTTFTKQLTGTPRKVQHREVEIFLITQYHLGWEVSSHGTWNRDETIVKKTNNWELSEIYQIYYCELNT